MFFRKAVLIIHGFGGGVYDEEYLANRLELFKNFDVFSFTLPGHDGLKNMMKEENWVKKTEEMVEFLINNNYKTIYVIGHSMGGVLACRVASKYKEVKKVVLIAAAFRYLEFEDDSINVLKSLVKVPGLAMEYKDEFISRLQRMPISSLKEFMNTVKNNQDTLDNINIPTLIVQGMDDNLVLYSTANYIYDRIPSKNKKILFYEKVNHDVFRSIKKDEISNQIISFLKNN